MDYFELTTRSPEETHKLGMAIGRLARPGDVFLLSGELGTGKTCLTQGIAWGLGVEGYALSPSFVIVRELEGRLPLYHVDLYRLDNMDEILDMGLDDYFYGKGVSVVEWAEKGSDTMPSEHLLIKISYLSDTGRRFQMEPAGERYQELSAEIKKLFSSR